MKKRGSMVSIFSLLSVFNPFSGKKGFIWYTLLCLALIGVYFLLPSSSKLSKKNEHSHFSSFQKTKKSISPLNLGKITGVESGLSSSHRFDSLRKDVENLTKERGEKRRDKAGGETKTGIKAVVEARTAPSFSKEEIGIPCSCDKDEKIFVCRCGERENEFLGCVEGGKERVLKLLGIERDYSLLKRRYRLLKRKYYSLLGKKKRVVSCKATKKDPDKRVDVSKKRERGKAKVEVGIVCLDRNCNLVVGGKSYREGAKIGDYYLWKIYVDGVVVAKGKDGAGGVFFVGKDSLSDFVGGLK